MSLIPVLLAHAASVTAGALLGIAAAVVPARRAVRSAQLIAHLDDVTGLPNRRALFAHLAAARRHGEPVAIAMFDLDGFKQVNDAHGHAAGDDLLKVAAARLDDEPEPVRFVARLQGDEFVLVIDLSHATDIATALTAATRAWRNLTDKPAPVAGQQVWLAASVGVAVPRTGVTARELLHHADLALYAAKDAGGDRVVSHDPAQDEPLQHRPTDRARDRHRIAEPDEDHTGRHTARPTGQPTTGDRDWSPERADRTDPAEGR